MSDQLRPGGPPPDHVHYGVLLVWQTEPFTAPDTGTVYDPCVSEHCRINQERRL